jgi:hypothetical protein
MKNEDINTIMDDAVQSLETTSRPQFVRVSTTIDQVARLANIIITTTILTTTALFLLFIIILYP